MLSSIRWLAVAAFVSICSAQEGGKAPPSAAELAAEEAAAQANTNYMNYILIVCGSIAGALIIWRVILESVKYVRLLSSLGAENQNYFAIPSQHFANFKKHVLYAPIFRVRHNREIMLSSAVNIGTLPTRLQASFIAGYLGTNVAFCVLSIDWSGDFSDVASALRNRTGILAVTNMIPLFIMAARNNPLINWLNISFDTFNLLHRWFGRIVVLEAVTHAFAWIASDVHSKGWSAVQEAINESQFIMYGFIAVIAFFTISIQASSPIRHAFYESFKYLHIGLVIMAIVGLWYHLKIGEIVDQFKLLVGIITLWCLERFARIVKLVYRNIGSGGTKALVESLPGNAVRVTVDMARPWNFKPGQHAYIYMPSIGLMQSHPFSVAWSEESERLDDEKGLAMNRQDILSMQNTSMAFVIRGRTGFTKKLCEKAAKSVDGRFTTSCLLEGPYGGMHMMHSYGTVMLFAGGVGITHQVPHVRDLVAGFSNGTIATRKIVLVWIIQSPEHLEWIRPWMTSILAMDRRRDCLRIMLFVSRPRSTKEIHSPSATVQMFPGRPNIETLIQTEVATQVGAMGVTVCGPGVLSDDVRRAVRSHQNRANIDFVEEAFSW